MPGEEASVLQFIPKVVSEDKALCRPLEFLHTNQGKPCLSGPGHCTWALSCVNMFGPFSILRDFLRYSRQLFASNFVATVWEKADIWV